MGMLSPVFASATINGFYNHPITASNVYTVLSPDPVKVIGFIVSPVFIPVALTITIASADNSVIYREIRMDGTTTRPVISSEPWIADRGLAWKSVGAIATLIDCTFFVTQVGS